MHESKVDVKTPDGVSDSTLYTPSHAGVWPGVLMYTDIFGVRPAFHGMAKRLAAEGFAVLLPNVYYRLGKVPLFTETPSWDKLREMKDTLTPQRVTADAGAYIDFLAAQKTVSPDAKMGVVGYCMSGSFALRAAALRPHQVGAAASFHGGHLCTDSPDSPHRLLPKIRAHLYIGHASDDPSMPADAIAKLDAELKAWGGRYETETYSAKHGWCVPGGGPYDEAEAERAWKKLVSLFQHELR